MDPKCVYDAQGRREAPAGPSSNGDTRGSVVENPAVERLCVRCLEAGGYCVGCLRTVVPQLAINRGWLRLMANVKAKLNPLAETPPVSAAGAAARRREERKAKKAQASRIGRLISGQLAPACTTRVVAAHSL